MLDFNKRVCKVGVNNYSDKVTNNKYKRSYYYKSIM